MSGRETRIAAVRLLCSNPERTAQFYERALGFHRQESENRLVLGLGQQRIELVAAAEGSSDPAPANATTFQHFAIVVSEMESAYRELERASGWSAISQAGPQQLPAASGGVIAFKFRDLDGHPLELLAFPPAAAPSAWRGLKGVFLGIDHTAITVADTQRSVEFYAGLGFTIASRNLNQGPEQARLDAIDAPFVEVTGLRPRGGAPPHLELLCYRQPKPLRITIPSNDVLATRIVLADIPDEEKARALDATYTDPDGHRLIGQN